jgi:hypothetical protein
MKIITLIVTCLSTSCFGQNIDTNPVIANSEKAKHFELFGSYGIGTATIPKKEIAGKYVPMFQKQYWTPMFQLSIGTKISNSVSVGIRTTFHQIKYGFNQSNFPSYGSNWVVTNFGTPTTVLGIYGRFAKRFGFVTPYVSAHPSVVLSSIQFSYVGGTSNPKYQLTGFAYGGAIGVRFHLSKALSVYPEFSFTKFNVLYDVKQTIASAGVAYLF